jgi:hypothetical protein
MLLSYARSIKHYRAGQSIWILLESCPKYTLVISLKTWINLNYMLTNLTLRITFFLVCLFCKRSLYLQQTPIQTPILLYVHPTLKLQADQEDTPIKGWEENNTVQGCIYSRLDAHCSISCSISQSIGFKWKSIPQVGLIHKTKRWL